MSWAPHTIWSEATLLGPRDLDIFSPKAWGALTCLWVLQVALVFCSAFWRRIRLDEHEIASEPLSRSRLGTCRASPSVGIDVENQNEETIVFPRLKGFTCHVKQNVTQSLNVSILSILTITS